MTLHYVYNISIHLSLSLIFDSSTTLVQMMPLLSKLLVPEWNTHNSAKVLYLFFVYCWVRLLQYDQIHNYALKRGVLYMMSKRSLSSEPKHFNLTRKIARWTCSSVRGSNEPSNPIRIKKIHSHLIITDIKWLLCDGDQQNRDMTHSALANALALMKVTFLTSYKAPPFSTHSCVFDHTVIILLNNRRVI
jgi:hypothetical protein